MTLSHSIDQKNAHFWDELCGTQLAKSLGIEDASPAALKKFDDWYFSFYPYLFLHIPFNDMNGKDVLEVGLGYGTVSQRIAECGANYSGLDIAPGPVSMVNHRLASIGKEGKAQLGSILAAPFPDQSFDYIVAIGCLHHTGDLKKAIAESHRLLRPGGLQVLMVYYAYSYRRWSQSTLETVRYLTKELLGYRGVPLNNNVGDRAQYDTNQDGSAAPHTDWISDRSLRSYCRDFKKYSSKLENVDNDHWFEKSEPRRELLKTVYPKFIGLDIYATVQK